VPRAGNPCGTAPRPFRRLEISSDLKESITMTAVTVRRVRHASRTTESDRKNAAAALQRALDRRDNGGATGH
jgi:hypothetical protein